MKRQVDWPRYMKEKPLKNGGVAYYWEPHERDRAAGFTAHHEPLGGVYSAARDRAVELNALLDDWRRGRGQPKPHIDQGPRAGTIDWWVECYTRTDAYLLLSLRSQDDYREALERLADLPTKTIAAKTGKPGRVGELPVSSLSPTAVDLLYKQLRKGGRVTRQANLVIDIARIAWRVVARSHAGLFMVPVETPEGLRRIAVNPFVGLVRVHGHGTTQPATRAEAFALAVALAEIGHASLGAVAAVAFEWLQRPENVIAGHLAWTHYRPSDRPAQVQIYHHKTGERLWLRLEDGKRTRLYPELENILAGLPRLGVPIVMFRPKRGPKDSTGLRTPRIYSESYADHLVQKARTEANLPSHVTLAACRHGGMTELGDAELTEQAVMALSGHRTPAAARLYMKRTEKQRITGAVKRRRYVNQQLRKR